MRSRPGRAGSRRAPDRAGDDFGGALHARIAPMAGREQQGEGQLSRPRCPRRRSGAGKGIRGTGFPRTGQRTGTGTSRRPRSRHCAPDPARCRTPPASQIKPTMPSIEADAEQRTRTHLRDPAPADAEADAGRGSRRSRVQVQVTARTNRKRRGSSQAAGTPAWRRPCESGVYTTRLAGTGDEDEDPPAVAQPLIRVEKLSLQGRPQDTAGRCRHE